MFIVALFIITKTQKQPKCSPTDEWMKKMWYAYTHTHTHTHKYYSAIKKKENFPFVAAWMDLDSTMLNEMSVRERQIYDITYMWNLKLQQTSEYKKKKQTHR